MRKPILIGISGKKGSGKDLVGRMIQLYEYNKRVLSLLPISPKAINDNVTFLFDICCTIKIKKYADSLKQISSIILGQPIEMFEDRDFKNSELGPEWNYEVVHVLEQGVYTSEIKKMTVREFMQRLGTNGCRDSFHKNIWINALFSKYTQESSWVITDCRFLNEAEQIKSRGGYLIRINRPTEDNKKVDLHKSETELDNYNFDYFIENDSDIDSLYSKVSVILDEIYSV
jgi:hypothetical protein